MSLDPAQTIAVDGRGKVAGVLLDVAHRAGALALFATAAVWGLIFYKGEPTTGALAAATVAADVGLCAAVGARVLATDPQGRRRTTGVLLFNGVVFALSLVLMLLDRVGPIHDAMAAFFSPAAVAPAGGR